MLANRHMLNRVIRDSPQTTRWYRSWREARGQTITEFVLIAGLLVGIAITLNSIIPPGMRQFVGRVNTSISGVAP